MLPLHGRHKLSFAVDCIVLAPVLQVIFLIVASGSMCPKDMTRASPICKMLGDTCDYLKNCDALSLQNDRILFLLVRRPLQRHAALEMSNGADCSEPCQDLSMMHALGRVSRTEVVNSTFFVLLFFTTPAHTIILD